MVGKTIRKVLTKAITSLTVASIVVGSFSGTTYAAAKKGILLDIHTDVLSLVMNSADELVVNPYDSMIVCDYNPYLAIRETADYEGEIVGKLYSASYGEIIEKGDEWTKIKSGDVTGYVPTKDVSIGDAAEELAKEIGTQVAKVNVEQLNIRSGPNFYSQVVYSGKMNETYVIVPDGYKLEDNIVVNDQTGEEIDGSKCFEPIQDESGNEWYRIHLNGCYYGYVYADCVAVVYELSDAVSIEEEEAERNKRLVQEAWSKQYQASLPAGTPVVYETVEKNDESQSATGTTESNNVDSGFADTDASSTVQLTEDEIYLLACLLYCEAGAENYEAQLAIANVVLNRIKNPYFPDTLSDVIYQPEQFGPAINGMLAKALANGTSDSCMQATLDALDGKNNIGNLLFFRLDCPSNASKVYTIGPIIFYTFPWLE